MIYINDAIDQFPLSTALQEISEQRREQAMQFKFEQGRRLCVAAYQLLQKGLLLEYDITEPPIFGYEADGKPFIEGHPDVHFNLSHCHEAAICAVSDHPVGIDIESIRPFKDSLARYTMNDDELRLIHHSTHPEVAFIRLWTMKEALLKLTGKGIRNNLRDVLSVASDKIRFSTVINQPRHYIYSICEYR